MSICRAPRKYPMIVRKVCPYCGKGNDILIQRWQENRQRMFCPGTNHASLIKKRRIPWVDIPNITEEVVDQPEVVASNRQAEYVTQLRKMYNLD